MTPKIEKIFLPELQNKKVCVSLSGGLDSTILIHLLTNKYGKDNVVAVGFNYGQRHVIELEMAKKTTERLGIKYKIINLEYLPDVAINNCSLIDGSILKPKTAEENSGNPQVDTYVPYRNAQFAFITAAYAESNNCSYIFQGLNAVDEYGYWDTTSEFVSRINNILSLNRMTSLQFLTPFVSMYKEDELRIAKVLSELFGYDILEYTWSCYNGSVGVDGLNKECGYCNTCSEKLKGYILAAYSDEIILKKFNITQEELQNLKVDFDI